MTSINEKHFILAAIALSSCGGSESVELKCVAFCNVIRCDTERPELAETCMEDCPCMDALWRDSVKLWYNDCGAEPTCEAVEAYPFHEPARRAIDDIVMASCMGFGDRCDLDVDCSFFYTMGVYYASDYLERHVDCYDHVACTDLTACLDALQPPECR